MTSTPAAYTHGQDICQDFTYNNNGYSTTNIFYENTGGLTFDTDDKDTFPPGTYTFIFTITIGSSQVPITVDMILHNPCEDAVLTIINDPFTNGPFNYVLGDTETIIQFNMLTMVSSDTDVHCGIEKISFFMMVNGNPTALDSSIFNVDSTTPEFSEF